MAQSGYGKIKLFNDFTGEELQTPPQVDHAATMGALWNIGQGFTIKGEEINDDVADINTVVDGLNGQILCTTSDGEATDSMFVTTETCFKPSVNAPMVFETRMEMAALGDREIFAGFVGTMDDEQSTLLTCSAEAITYTESDLCGFAFDTGLTTDAEWHMVYSGGSTTADALSTNLNSGIAPVAGEMNVLRVEIDNNGTARWYIDGVLLKTLAGAVSTTAIFAGCVGAVCTDTVSVTWVMDYISVTANRDWTI